MRDAPSCGGVDAARQDSGAVASRVVDWCVLHVRCGSPFCLKFMRACATINNKNETQVMSNTMQRNVNHLTQYVSCAAAAAARQPPPSEAPSASRVTDRALDNAPAGRVQAHPRSAAAPDHGGGREPRADLHAADQRQLRHGASAVHPSQQRCLFRAVCVAQGAALTWCVCSAQRVV